MTSIKLDYHGDAPCITKAGGLLYKEVKGDNNMLSHLLGLFSFLWHGIVPVFLLMNS